MTAEAPPPTNRVHFVSLGCPKNRVDSEIMLGHLQDASMTVTDEAEDADVIVVNTCGFIEDAKKESIDVILEMARHRTEGRARRLIVTGCLVQRYAQEIASEIPEIDVLLGNGAYASVAEAAQSSSLLPVPRIQIEPPRFLHQATTPRVNTFLPHSAYVKVSEGCDQKCSFCAIPSMRGLQRSRPIHDIVDEVSTLGARGIVEVNLIAQDLTGYGTDLTPRASLAELLRSLGGVDHVRWLRLHYAYPRPFSRALLEAMAEEPKVLPYLDMPLQHIADPILKRMQRGRPRRFIERLLGDIRASVPEIVMRTSFIVGFPGETESEFKELLDFVEEQDFERVGVFRFSREEGTPSFDLPDQVPKETIDERYDRLMTSLAKKSRARMESYVGRRLAVLVDGVSDETDLLLTGRHKGQAPEIDGTTYINDGEARTGDIVEVEITEAFDYDIVGHVTQILFPAPPRPEHPRLEHLPVEHPRTEHSRHGHASLRVLPG
ncbi:MAG: 30S ribosomal protein S12 methylthiotransferase RimO [Deltaproteobacteria bacterium]|nr:30S ribosomal protein S12 methylthiotransferase RimO [Deltaproteobacteria bacterium]